MAKNKIKITYPAKNKMELTYLGSSAGYEVKDASSAFFITSIQERGYKKPVDPKMMDRTRCWGWMPTHEDAVKAVECNAFDMAECCYYSHVVIEKVGSGIPNLLAGEEGTETWFKWKVDPKDPHRFNGQWIKCKKPEWSKHIVGWGIG